MDQLKKIPRYERGMPYKPIYSDFLDELKETWGEEWGIKSPFGKIRKAMVCSPGDEQKSSLISEDYQLFNLPEGPTDFDKLQKEHRALVAALEAEDIEVIYLNSEKPFIGIYGIPLRSAPYASDAMMVRGGAIIARLAPAYKKRIGSLSRKETQRIRMSDFTHHSWERAVRWRQS